MRKKTESAIKKKISLRCSREEAPHLIILQKEVYVSSIIRGTEDLSIFLVYVKGSGKLPMQSHSLSTCDHSISWI